MCRILVISEGGAAASTLVRQLRGDGYMVDSAQDGADGLAQAAATAPGAIVLVGTRPDSTGLELCRALRELCPSAPIIVLTPSTNPSARIDALDAGAIDCLSIPYSVEEFKARLRARLRIAGCS